jgi:GTP-binding protein
MRGGAPFFGHRQLRRDSRAYLRRRDSIAGRDAVDAHGFRRVHHDQPVEIPVPSGFHQERSFVERQTMAGLRERRGAFGRDLRDSGMHDRLQSRARCFITKHDGSQLVPIQSLVRSDHVRPQRGDFGQGGGAGLGDLPRQLIGVDHGDAAFRDQAGHGRLAAADSTRQADEAKAAAHRGNANLRRLSQLTSVPEVRAATFLAEARSFASLPPVGSPEIAIAGRSNVGKSTLLNRLAGRHALARTSKTPGRTRGIIFYDLEIGPGAGRGLRLADLPGYGYARVSQSERASWKVLLEGYATHRATLALFVVLVDARRGIEAEERQLIEWLDTLSIPARVAFTKVDKLSASSRGRLRDSLRLALPGMALGRPLLVSGQTGEGIADVWATILRTLPRLDAASEPAGMFAVDD